MLAGDLYLPSDPELVEHKRRAALLLHRFNQSAPDAAAARRGTLGELLGALGEASEIRPPFQCSYGAHISVGTGTFVNVGCIFLDIAAITIGDDVQIGPNVQLLTAIHPIEPELRQAKWESAEPITIRDNVWLGGGVIVLPGVSIGEHTVVGAGAVVTRDLPADVVAVGNPARVTRSR